MRLPRLLDIRRPQARSLWALALLFTLFNAAKPLLIDDAAYYYFARQITRDPLRPYAFSMFWYQWPHPAIEILAPPVLPYWWAIALALFGENTFLWKIWLFPFGFLFVAGLAALLRRFARSVAEPVLWMTVLSPTFLPSFNLMLDVPALALSLGAVAVFIRAYNRRSMVGALLAGLLAGLAMETKYTGFLAPAVLLLYTVVFWGRPFAVNFRRRVLLGILAVLVAGGLFLSWEVLIAHYHGESHFLCNLRQNDDTWRNKLNLTMPLLMVLGGLSPPIILLSLTALGTTGRIVAATGAVLALGFVLIAGIPSEMFAVESLVFAGFGIVTLATAAAVMGRLLNVVVLLRGWNQLTTAQPVDFPPLPCTRGRGVGGVGFAKAESPSPPTPLPRSTGGEGSQMVVFAALDWFLLLWLGGEVLGCFALTPFPAGRRVMGLIVVGTLLAARLAARSCRGSSRQALLRGVAAAGIGLGLVFYGVDLHGAFAEKEAAEGAADWVRQRDTRGTVWYVGHWGFQHYAEHAGMKPVIPDQSYLRKGDWLVVPDRGINQQEILVDSYCTEAIARLRVDDPLPLRTVPSLYGGHLPVEHQEGPRLVVAIYRVTRPFVPASDRE